MKVTINDIAKAAGVAKSTVSKVINDAPTISEATKQKIREIMKQMNYIPSSIATQLARQKCFNVGLVIDLSRGNHFLNHFFYNIIGGVENVVGKMNYELTISNMEIGGSDNFLNRFVLSGKVDGLVLDNSILTPEIAEELNELGFPFVSIGEMDSINWVDIDNRTGGKMVTDHLLGQGYRKLAFVGGEDREPIFQHRYEGFRQALEQFGGESTRHFVKPGFAVEANGHRLMSELLDSGDVPDAVVCMNNYIAFGVLNAVRERGFSIPEEMGIVTFDDYPLAQFTTPPLTCLDNDTFELGILAGTMLMNRINDPDLEDNERLIEPRLIVRESSRRLA